MSSIKYKMFMMGIVFVGVIISTTECAPTLQGAKEEYNKLENTINQFHKDRIGAEGKIPISTFTNNKKEQLINEIKTIVERTASIRQQFKSMSNYNIKPASYHLLRIYNQLMATPSNRMSKIYQEVKANQRATTPRPKTPWKVFSDALDEAKKQRKDLQQYIDSNRNKLGIMVGFIEGAAKNMDRHFNDLELKRMYYKTRIGMWAPDDKRILHTLQSDAHKMRTEMVFYVSQIDTIIKTLVTSTTANKVPDPAVVTALKEIRVILDDFPTKMVETKDSFVKHNYAMITKMSDDALAAVQAQYSKNRDQYNNYMNDIAVSSKQVETLMANVKRMDQDLSNVKGKFGK